ncbi:MAG: hypothetical protein ACK535_06450, partial [Cyanobacteriota bacterium]
IVCGNKAPCERRPNKRPSWHALVFLAIANSLAFDFALRMKVQATVNLFILNGCPMPNVATEAQVFIAHAALRLSCNHAGYSELWKEQLGGIWREETPQDAWPVLSSKEDCLSIRCAVDALVADAYGLSRHQYEHLLSSFSHSSYPKAPFLCLDAFDEIHESGIDFFAKKYDPYWDIPLNDNLPQPVIDLAIPGKGASSLGPLFDEGAAESTGVVQPPVRASLSTAAVPNQHTVSATQSLDRNGAFTTITDLLHSQEVITSSDAQQATGLDAAGVRPHLQQLVQQGLAVTEGQRRGMRYRRVDG